MPSPVWGLWHSTHWPPPAETWGKGASREAWTAVYGALARTRRSRGDRELSEKILQERLKFLKSHKFPKFPKFPKFFCLMLIHRMYFFWMWTLLHRK